MSKNIEKKKIKGGKRINEQKKEEKKRRKQ